MSTDLKEQELKLTYTKKITTTTYHKEELFKLLAICEATSHPLLFIGPPGVAKTQCVTEYSQAIFEGKDDNLSEVERYERVFNIELDDSTRPKEIKGSVDIKALLQENKYQIDSPASRAEVFIVNEVDKGSSQIQNALLGIMNEKKIFNGSQVFDCKWKLFVATCNSIPKEEKGNHFWDRFLIKYEVGRLSETQLKDYCGLENKEQTIELTIPTKAGLDSVHIPKGNFDKFIAKMHSRCTDRSIIKVMDIIKATKIVYDCSVEEAMIKACIFLTNDKLLANEISNAIHPAVFIRLRNSAQTLVGLPKRSSIITELNLIEDEIKKAFAKGLLTKHHIEELNNVINESLDNNIHYKESDDLDDLNITDEDVKFNDEANGEANSDSDDPDLPF